MIATADMENNYNQRGFDNHESDSSARFSSAGEYGETLNTSYPDMEEARNIFEKSSENIKSSSIPPAFRSTPPNFSARKVGKNNPEFRMTCEEVESEEDAAALLFLSGIVEAKSGSKSYYSDSESKNESSKRTEPTTLSSADTLGSITKTKRSIENDEGYIDDPEAFIANISEHIENVGRRSHSEDSSKLKRSDKNDSVDVDDPEVFFAKILEAREGRGSIHSKAYSGGNSKVKRSGKDKKGCADDPEAFFAHVSKTRKKRSKGRKKKEACSDENSKDENCEEGNKIDDSYEVLLAGLSYDMKSIDAKTAGVQRSPRKFERQYKSDDEEEEEERIISLHKEMKKIGISPTIMVDEDDGTRKSGSKSSLGEDSYLEDLLQQRQHREDDHREEVMEEALEQYKAIEGPKSEQLFLDMLEVITRQKEEEFAERDLIQDKRISKELEFRQERSMRTPLSRNEPEQIPNDIMVKQPESDRSLSSKTPKSDSKNPSSVRKKTQPEKDIIQISDGSADQSGVEIAVEKEGNGSASMISNDDMEPSPNPIKPVYNKNPDESSSSSLFLSPSESSPSSSSSSVARSSSFGHREDDHNKGDRRERSINSHHSINGFEDEYYYDVERAMLDRKEEADLLRQESDRNRKLIYASISMCCVAFGLILVVIVDPLDRRSQ